MKELLLIFSILAAFGFGYYVMTKVGEFIEENQHLMNMESCSNSSHIRLAAQSHVLLNAVGSALEFCSEMNPHIKIFQSSGKTKRLLQKLMDETLDIVLLSEDMTQDLDKCFRYIRIPFALSDNENESHGEEQWIYVIWNRTIVSKDRDRVIFALENENYRLKTSYCNYN